MSDIWDHESGRARLCARECDTCIFKTDSPFRTGPGKLHDGRFRELVSEAKKAETYVICHSTIGGDEAICRGFHDRFSTNMLRIASRLGGGRFTEVEPGHV